MKRSTMALATTVAGMCFNGAVFAQPVLTDSNLTVETIVAAAALSLPTPGANHDAGGDSNGTTITVPKP